MDLNEARDDRVLGWQWHQLDSMQTICTLLQTDNHTNTPSLNFYNYLYLINMWSVALILRPPHNCLIVFLSRPELQHLLSNTMQSHYPRKAVMRDYRGCRYFSSTRSWFTMIQH